MTINHFVQAFEEMIGKEIISSSESELLAAYRRDNLKWLF